MTLAQLEAIIQAYFSPGSNTGTIMLDSGEKITGTWNTDKTNRLVHITDNTGIPWIIDLNRVIGIQPQPAP